MVIRTPPVKKTREDTNSATEVGGANNTKSTDTAEASRSYNTKADRRERRPYWDTAQIEEIRKELPTQEKVTRSKVKQVSRNSPPRTRSPTPQVDNITPISVTKPVAFTVENTPVNLRGLRRSPRLNSTPLDKPADLTKVIQPAENTAEQTEVSLNASCVSNISTNSDLVFFPKEQEHIRVSITPIEEVVPAEKSQKEPLQDIAGAQQQPATNITNPNIPLEPAIVVVQGSQEQTPVTRALTNVTQSQLTTESSTLIDNSASNQNVIKKIFVRQGLNYNVKDKEVEVAQKIREEKKRTEADQFEWDKIIAEDKANEMTEKPSFCLKLFGKDYILKEGSTHEPQACFNAKLSDLAVWMPKGKDFQEVPKGILEEAVKELKEIKFEISKYEHFMKKHGLEGPSMDKVRMNLMEMKCRAIERIMVLDQLERQEEEAERKENEKKRREKEKKKQEEEKKKDKERLLGLMKDKQSPPKEEKEKPEPEKKKEEPKKKEKELKKKKGVAKKKKAAIEDSYSESEEEIKRVSESSDSTSENNDSNQEEDEETDSEEEEQAPRRSRTISSDKRLKKLELQISKLRNLPMKKKPTPLVIKPFGGDKDDYIRFKTAFVSCNEDTGLTKVELAIRLGECLVGEPKQSFGWMAKKPKDSTYKAMWKSLDTFYGTEDEQNLTAIEKFNRMPDIKVFNAKTAHLLYCTLNMHWDVLKEVLKKDFESEDNYIFRPFLKKLPLAESIKFKDMCTDTGKKKTFRTFRDWLLRQYKNLSDDKDKSLGKLSADKALQFWSEDIEPESEPNFYVDNVINEEGEIVDISNDLCSVTFDEDGTPITRFRPAEGSLVYFNKGKATKIKEYSIPHTSFSEAAERNANAKRTFNRKGLEDKTSFGRKSLEDKTSRKSYCVHCTKEDHMVYQCKSFEKAPMKAKLSTVKENKLCFRCLSKGHLAKDCKVKFVCNVNKCGKRHHRLLHAEEPSKSYFNQLNHQGLGSDVDESDLE